MGVDIHLYIVKENGESNHEEIYEGRNSEWFDALCGRSFSKEYHYLPTEVGLPDNVPNKIRIDATDKMTYYGFHFIKVRAFYDWFEKYRPHIDAGWVHKYDAWLYLKKGIYPEDCYHYVDSIDDFEFIEFENEYDNSKWLYNYIKDHKDIEDNDYIVYYFDC